MSLRRRLTLASAAAVALAIVLASLVGYLVVRGQLRGQVDDSLRTLVSGIAIESPPSEPTFEKSGSAALPRPEHTEARVRAPAPDVQKRVIPLPGAVILRSDQPSPKDGADVLVLPPPALGGARTLTQIVAADGDVSRPADNRIRLPVDDRARAVASGRARSYFSELEIQGTHLRVYTARVGDGYALQAARSLDEVDTSLRNLGLILGGVALGGIALAVVLGLFVTRATLTPVERLSVAAEEVARTRNLARRIEADGSDELSALAQSFNTMLAALERSRDAQRQLVADASHELRTPLTSLQTNLEVLASGHALEQGDRERLLSDLIGQLEELGDLVGDLVELARDEERPTDLEDIRFDLLVADAVDRARRHHPNIRFVVEANPCVVRAAPPRLERAVSNLLDNAAKWSPTDGVVEVAVARGELVVRDHGPGFAEEDLPHLFDRFYRAPSARGTPGSGLGLAIVRQVAESSGGTVRAEQASGGGAQLRLALPPVAIDTAALV